jgi:protein-S-isoprenylcysteine O-methyltransferase Ste14
MEQDRGPNVRFPPPALFLGWFLIGLALNAWVRPLSLVHGGATPPALRLTGWTLAVLGVALAWWGSETFRRAKTPVYPAFPATRIVTNGPYRFTRNPMYVGLTLLYAGVSLVLNQEWPLLLLPIVLILLHKQVIEREERYLSEAFAEEYGAYRKRVRRWI